MKMCFCHLTFYFTLGKTKLGDSDLVYMRTDFSKKSFFCNFYKYLCKHGNTFKNVFMKMEHQKQFKALLVTL